jgi:hypothetical protein
MREYDVTALTGPELELARRELTASLALARPDSAVRGPILTQLSAIDAELAQRATKSSRSSPPAPATGVPRHGLGPTGMMAR